jgi:hypothetical protein
MSPPFGDDTALRPRSEAAHQFTLSQIRDKGLESGRAPERPSARQDYDLFRQRDADDRRSLESDPQGD